jgi:hypothetical protein
MTAKKHFKCSTSLSIEGITACCYAIVVRASKWYRCNYYTWLHLCFTAHSLSNFNGNRWKNYNCLNWGPDGLSHAITSPARTLDNKLGTCGLNKASFSPQWGESRGTSSVRPSLNSPTPELGTSILLVYLLNRIYIGRKNGDKREGERGWYKIGANEIL